MYPSSFVKNDMANMGFSNGGSGARTYKYYQNEFGTPLFRFGTGLSYTQFGLEKDQHVSTAASVVSSRVNDTFCMHVTNRGETPSVCIR